MQQIVCVYCEGTDSKFAVFELNKGEVRLLKTASVDLYKPGRGGAGAGANLGSTNEEFNLDGAGTDLLTDSIDTGSAGSQILEGVINSELSGFKLHKCSFVPILTEPALYYQPSLKKGTTGAQGSLTQEIMSGSGTQVTEKNGKSSSQKKKKKSGRKSKPSDKETSSNVEMADGGSLKVHLRQDTSCIQMINRLARYNNKRNYKITAVKSAEVSLASYIAKKKKFFPDDYSLVVYIGKEYSKLVFLYGRKIKHIGSTLDIGTSNLHTYDVYFSKILLEMENGAIPNLDNIIVCGEDVSENLVLSFYGTFPETNVSRLEFDELDTSELSEGEMAKISSFSIPIAVMNELVEESEKKFEGINLIPAWVLEEQKIFQFAWHGFLMLPLLFVLAFYFTQAVLTNNAKLRQMEKEIEVKENLKLQNLEILGQIENLDARINSFDQTQTILDSVSVGAELWGRVLNKVAVIGSEKRNFWLRSLNLNENKEIKLEGHALFKNVLTDVTSKLDSALLRSITYDAIREKDAYRFIIYLKEPNAAVNE